jgi:hypothetical protein
MDYYTAQPISIDTRVWCINMMVKVFGKAVGKVRFFSKKYDLFCGIF